VREGEGLSWSEGIELRTSPEKGAKKVLDRGEIMKKKTKPRKRSPVPRKENRRPFGNL